MVQTLHSPVTKYLSRLERCLKSKSGVVPEDALATVRSHLQEQHRKLREMQPELSDEQLLEQFSAKYGTPEEVAEQYEDVAQPFQQFLPGYAPGWPIFCTQCGRSVPLAKAGGVRIGAKSKHKYVLGWCRGCRWFRWLRVIQDLDDANLTERLGAEQTPEAIRATMHMNLWIVSLLFAVGLVATIVPLLLLFR